MSQATTWGVPSVGPATPTTMASRMNDALNALLSDQSGSVAPTYAVAGTRWLDNSAVPWVLKVYDGADWISLYTINPTTNALAWLGLGTMATQNAGSVAITGGTVQSVAITGGTVQIGSPTFTGGVIQAQASSAITAGFDSAATGGSGACIGANRSASDGWVAGFYRAGSGVGSIAVTNSATSYNTSSDYRLKNNIRDLEGSGAFIDALRPRQWDWAMGGLPGTGFVAHEVQAVSPSSVTGEKDATDEEGNPVYQGMQPGSPEIVANLVAEVQALRARVAALEGAA